MHNGSKPVPKAAERTRPRPHVSMQQWPFLGTTLVMILVRQFGQVRLAGSRPRGGIGTGLGAIIIGCMGLLIIIGWPGLPIIIGWPGLPIIGDPIIGDPIIGDPITTGELGVT